MIPYLVAVGLIEASRIIKLDTKGKKFLVCLFCALIFILLLGLRHPSMGQDLLYLSEYGYLGGFRRIAKSSWEIDTYQNYEWGYIIFNKFVSIFTDDTQVFLVICAACSILPFAYGFYKYSDDIQTSFIIFFGNPVFYYVIFRIETGTCNWNPVFDHRINQKTEVHPICHGDMFRSSIPHFGLSLFTGISAISLRATGSNSQDDIADRAIHYHCFKEVSFYIFRHGDNI